MQSAHISTALPTESVSSAEEVVFDVEEDMDFQDMEIQGMSDDFLVAGKPYPRIVLTGMKVGSFFLYCYYKLEKGVRYSFSKTLRVFRGKY